MPDSVGYFMVSFDLDHHALAYRRVDELNVYLPLHEVQGGVSYAVRPGHQELRNTYRFHHPQREIAEIVHHLQRSVHANVTRLADILLPELFDCAKICVARKRSADAIYYSGITVEQLLFFLKKFDYPDAIIQFVREHQSDLDHLRFDVGIDYHNTDYNHNNKLVYTKTGYYSTL